MNDKTIAEVEKFAAKWCPLGRSAEFLADLGELIVVAVKESSDYILCTK